MKKNILISLSVIVAAFLASSCDRYYDGYYDPAYYETSNEFITLRNYSSEATVWFIPEKENSEILPSELSEWQKISVYEIDAHSAVTLTFDSDDGCVTPVETYAPTDRMVIYVFLKKVWDSHEWAELVSGEMWTGKYSYSVDEMLQLKKIVTYPTK